MSSIKITVYILILLTAANAQDNPGSGECKPELSIKTDLSSSTILLNGKIAGTGDLDSSVQKGKYIINVEENSEEWNAKVFSDTINIEECLVYNFNYKFKTGTYLQTNPEDVYVYRGDSLFGHTPLFIGKPDFLGNILELRKPGYENKIISPEDIKNNPVIKLNYVGKPNGKNFFERDIFKYLVGSIVVLGGATAYFKLKADNEFDDYQITGSRQSLKNTRRYDLISGISFAALQVNFGVLIYYFLGD
ncbi:MAG TPA: hypothetical protein VMT35_17090 [Ignavibacteriaceae bacterium]|nr:hypothetical protein [Ignavibacteriaceae bacterium]